LGFEISDNTCQEKKKRKRKRKPLEAFKEKGLYKSSQPNQWDVLSTNISATVGARKPRFYVRIVHGSGYLLNPKRGH